MLKNILKKILSNLGFEISRKNEINTVFQIDPLFNDLYENAQRETQMKHTDNALRRQRHYTLNYLLRNADLGSGDVCEVGCWRGLSAYQVASYLQSSDKNILFHIFDSFEGLSEIMEIDRYKHDNRDVESVRKQFACALNIVKDNLKEFNFIRYYKGWIPGRFNEVEGLKFSFVHIDVDLYQPIRDSFEFFYPRLAPKGIMVFDDYGCIQFPGAKKAVDECISNVKNIFFLPLPSGQAFLIKDFYE
jgi:hypothetical protein